MKNIILSRWYHLPYANQQETTTNKPKIRTITEKLQNKKQTANLYLQRIKYVYKFNFSTQQKKIYFLEK